MLHHDQQQMIRAADGGGFSTMSLSGITENILNKAMLEAYGNVESVVSDICYETDTNDFKSFKRYRLTGSGALQKSAPRRAEEHVACRTRATPTSSRPRARSSTSAATS
jgi:hypothetical protein